MNVLITGGASGLGEAVVKLLAQNINNKIYFTYAKSRENAQNLANQFLNTYPIKCDFRCLEEIKALTDLIGSIELDVLINNAYSGSFLKTHFHKIETSDFLNEFKENIIPVIDITKSVIVNFRKRKQGKIITILTSALFERAPVGASIYLSNKSYLERLAKVWAIENARFNISSNSISPTFMQTTLTSNIDERVVEQIKENNLTKKILTVEAVAETILCLINAPEEVSGTNIVVN